MRYWHSHPPQQRPPADVRSVRAGYAGVQNDKWV